MLLSANSCFHLLENMPRCLKISMQIPEPILLLEVKIHLHIVYIYIFGPNSFKLDSRKIASFIWGVFGFFSLC